MNSGSLTDKVMVGGAVNDAMNAAAQPAASTQPVAAEQPKDNMAAFKEKVEKLSIMKEAGLITEEEFKQMKATLLSEIL